MLANLPGILMWTRDIMKTTLVVAAVSSFGHGTETQPAESDRMIQFPDTADHKTLIVDLHTHSVFSDGHVWPKIRVAEAFKDGLDAMAITEHLEYQPHLADIPHPDRNRAYNDAEEAAKGSDLILIRGSEITRQFPAGHINAVFLEDSNKLLRVDDTPEARADSRSYYIAANAWPAQEAVQAANDQGAFVFWNHPFWGTEAADGITRMNKFHRRNAREGLLHGIEIANGDTYSEEAFDVALDHDLALIGVSDVHELIDWDYEPHKGGHRPVTLVFATERTGEAIREALFAQRTVVWFKNQLIGRPRDLTPLLEASLVLTKASVIADTKIVEATLENRSDVRFELRNRTKLTFMDHDDRVTVPPHETITLRAKPGKVITELALDFEVTNALTEPNKHPSIQLSSAVEPPPNKPESDE